MNTGGEKNRTSEASEEEDKHWNCVVLPCCQGHPAPCDRACLAFYVSFFFFFLSLQGPFIHPIPSFSFFPTFPEAEIPHRSHSNVRLSHGAPFSHFDAAPV